MTGRVVLQALATPLSVGATDRAVALEAQKPTAALPPVATIGRGTSMAAQRRAANPLHMWRPDGTTVRRALAAVVSRAAAARAAVVSLIPLLAATMTARLEPATRRSAVVLAAGTLSNLT